MVTKVEPLLCMEQNMVPLLGPVKQEPVADLKPVPMQHESQDGEEAYIDCSVASKVEPKDEITIEHHDISLGEGSDMSTTCSSADASSLSNWFLKEETEKTDQMGYKSSPVEGSNSKWKLKTREEISRQQFDDDASHIGNDTQVSKVFCEVTNYSGHTGSVVHKCTECDKSFSSVTSLNLHLNVHSGQEDHKCDRCGKCFIRGGNVRTDLNFETGQKDYTCSECGKYFIHRSVFIQHLKIHSGEKNHTCGECGKCFRDSTTLEQHLIIHSDMNDYKCTGCCKCLTDNRRWRRVYIHCPGKDHKCAKCGKCFPYWSGLKCHLRVHTGERDYTLAGSVKCSTGKSNLTNNSKIRSGVKGQKCGIRARLFTRSGNVRNVFKKPR